MCHGFECSIKKLFLSNKSICAASYLGRAKRGADKYTVELVVAVDNEMVDYYGDELYDVVMTAMNLTSDVYEQSNLKQSISISMLELIQLPFETSEFEDSPGTNGGKNAQKMLTKFCDYVKSTTLKYDAAVLITRYIIQELTFSRKTIEFCSSVKVLQKCTMHTWKVA